jgi:hypothetical protein
MKTEKIQHSHEKKAHTHLACEKTSHKKFEDPQNDKKEIENFGTSKYQN